MREVEILGTRVDAIARGAAIDIIERWATGRESRYVCLANTHMLVEAQHDGELRGALDASDLTCCDGMPLVWMQRALGVHEASRVRGPDLMVDALARAASAGLRVGLYGGAPQVLEKLAEVVRSRFDGIQLTYVHSPPFRPLEPAEQDHVIQEIADSGVQILCVGLGCPKQERWMAAHRGRVNAVMLGVGAAFDMHAGVIAQAPRWMQDTGLEWIDRLRQDPRRLLRRYARTNPKFVARALRQLVDARVLGQRFVRSTSQVDGAVR